MVNSLTRRVGGTDAHVGRIWYSRARQTTLRLPTLRLPQRSLPRFDRLHHTLPSADRHHGTLPRTIAS
jgi:hypothetical protein